MMMQPSNARNVPQSFAYPSTSKRSKTAAHAQQHMIPGPAPFVAYDDEEDTSAGDMFDHMTPRELSMARYTRNHEWMEEVLGSPYRIGQIQASDLGLGLQGELASVTRGIFEASGVDAHKKPPGKPVIGHLEPEQASLFRQRLADKILADQAEMAQMKAQHEKQTAKLKATSVLSEAEKELQVAVDETGSEFWRLESTEDVDEEGDKPATTKQHRRVDDIVADIESALGRHIEVVSDVKRVQDGGYQEPAPEPKALPVPPPAPATDFSGAGLGQRSGPLSHNDSFSSGLRDTGGNIDMGGTADGLMSQSQAGLSAHSLPHTHMTSISSNTAIMSEDTRMQDLHQIRDTTTASDQGNGSGDWVVVPKGGVSPSTSAAPELPPLAGPSEPGQLPGDFGDMNTAGEALNSYSHHSDGDLGDGMDLGVEDSAFGDAVFGVEESRGSAANTPAEGI